MFTRREFLRAAAVSGATLAAPVAPLAALAREPNPPDLEVALRAVRDEAEIQPGVTTHVWRYTGRVLSGDRSALSQPAGSYLGPTFRVRRGQRIRVRFANELPQPSIVHWHGLSVPETMDGHPRFAVGEGGEYLYEFTVRNRAGTYWYHPHPHRLTGPQVYGGLAGLFIVEDDEEKALSLPSGEFEIPLVIQDRRFGPKGELVYTQSPMERMHGFVGDTIVTNGRTGYAAQVRAAPHRLRILNGCNSRPVRLAFSDRRELTVIGTDGGLLERPETRRSVLLGPAERLDVWADFSDLSPGNAVELVSLGFDLGSRMGMMGRGGFSRLPVGAPFTAARFDVVGKGPDGRELPERLSTIDFPAPEDAVNADRPREFVLSMNHMQPVINGRTFEMTAVAPFERVAFGDLELWDFVNSGNMMMRLPHPMHVHGLSFRVVGRSGGSKGTLDAGLKDSVLVLPGERVRIALAFTDYKGLYLYHCHNLEHEDLGMMRNYLVE